MIKARCLKWKDLDEARHSCDDSAIIVLREEGIIGTEFCCFRPGNKTGRSKWYIFPNRTPKTFYICGACPATAEQFMEILLEKHPEDFEWILWHPGVLNGEYRDD